MAEITSVPESRTGFKCNGVKLDCADIKSLKNSDDGKAIVLFKNGVEVTFNGKAGNANGKDSSICLDQKTRGLLFENVKGLDIKGTSGSDIIGFRGDNHHIDLKTGAGDDLVIFDDSDIFSDSKIDTGAGDDDLLFVDPGIFLDRGSVIDLGSGKNNVLRADKSNKIFIHAGEITETGGQTNYANIARDKGAEVRFMIKWPMFQ